VTTSASGAGTAFESFNSIKSLDSIELAKNRGATITDSLAGQPGITVRSFGAGNARPIIRGFDGDRILIMQDGIRTGDLSSQSGDHAISIDPAGLERIEVVRGPATLLFGSNAVGGVVNAISPQDAFRAQPFSGLVAGATVDGGSANGQGGVNANVLSGRGPWLFWAGGGSRRTGDYDTPEGPVDNSATELHTVRAGTGWTGARSFFSVGGQLERHRFGVPFAATFEGEEGVSVDIKSERNDVRIDAGLRNLTSAFLDAVKVTFARSDYAHDELEIEEGEEFLGTAFTNTISSLRAELEQKRQGKLTGRLGVEWFGRDYTSVGAEALAPPTTQSAFSAFGYEEVNFGRYRLQFGGRVERTAYEPGARPPSPEEEEEEEEGPPAPRNRTFTGASGSFGVHADLGRMAAVVVNVTGASRAPALEELYNFGPHIGNLTFEIGNQELALERTTGLDVSLRSRNERLRGEVNVFFYNISNFVFLDVTDEIEDNLRVADFLQGDSRFVGFEAGGDIDIVRGLHLNVGVSAVRATLTETDEAVPRIPPITGRIELEVPWRHLSISPEVVVRARQSRVFRDEAATAGSTVINLGVTYFLVRGHATHAVTFKALNLANEAYRSHTSFIKDLALEMSRGVRVSYTVRFF
jgi:iron complex outermembrane receptor protein